MFTRITLEMIGQSGLQIAGQRAGASALHSCLYDHFQLLSQLNTEQLFGLLVQLPLPADQSCRHSRDFAITALDRLIQRHSAAATDIVLPARHP